ncbi:hypothetical protein DE146DRAFT_662664 [Phaeosphaeria sp. MPI-PUGE-AT-0046c]|nr:hypothetical protein DE146DRAFT_662664 [Phaeosphaeria sp. MPI-PUGE-AT-0046c]
MSLDALPAEIISRICRYIGIEVTFPQRDWHSELPVVINRFRDFQALRITCKELYHKTEYDAAIRYAHKLWSSEVCLEQSSLRKFLAVSRVPSFRDRFHEITFYNSDDPEDDEDDFEDSGSDELKLTSSMYNSIDRSFGIDMGQEQHADQTETRPSQRFASIKEFQASDEVAELMLGLFRNLDVAKSLEVIGFPPDFGYDLVLDALLSVKLTRKVVNLVIDPHYLATAGLQSHWVRPDSFAHCVRGLRFQPHLYYRHDEVQRLGSHDIDLDGLHIRGFRPTTPELTKTISAFVGVEYLELNGCRPNPELRFCHGCDDLFARNFAPMRYPHLTKLKVARVLISGGRLRAFIKHHAPTLTNIDIGYTTLTDGTWRSIGQGLAKLPLIEKLRLEHLQQKHHLDHDERPRHYMPSTTVTLNNFTDVKLFLEVFVTHFRTIARFSGARVTRNWPRYYEARLFRISEAET